MCNALSKWHEIKSFCRLCKQISSLVKAALMNLGCGASARRSLRIRRMGRASVRLSSVLAWVLFQVFVFVFIFLLPTFCVGNFFCLHMCECVSVRSRAFVPWAHGKRQVNISISTTAGAASAACQVTCNLWQANKNKHELMLLTHIGAHAHVHTYTCVTQISCT